MLKSLQDFLIHSLVCLGEVLSSLGMSDDNIFYACIIQHCGRDFSGVSTLLLKIHILGADMDIGAPGSFHSRNNVDSRHAEYYIHVVILYKGL